MPCWSNNQTFALLAYGAKYALLAYFAVVAQTHFHRFIDQFIIFVTPKFNFTLNCKYSRNLLKKTRDLLLL